MLGGDRRGAWRSADAARPGDGGVVWDSFCLVKVFISFDMEGVAGIVDWSQCRGPGQPYEEGRRLLLGEVNAAIDGAMAGGATEIVCNDSHGTMNNLDPAELHGQAGYVSGRHKPLYMMQGLDATADVVFMVGYHGSISGESSVLSHTYNPSVISHVALNGARVGESGINALVALACQAPVGLITGDQQTIAEADPFLPDAERVVVKESFTRFGASNLHPEVARELIADGARRAVERAAAAPAEVWEIAASPMARPRRPPRTRSWPCCGCRRSRCPRPSRCTCRRRTWPRWPRGCAGSSGPACGR